jgi:hypothetical protein
LAWIGNITGGKEEFQEEDVQVFPRNCGYHG